MKFYAVNLNLFEWKYLFACISNSFWISSGSLFVHRHSQTVDSRPALAGWEGGFRALAKGWYVSTTVIWLKLCILGISPTAKEKLWVSQEELLFHRMKLRICLHVLTHFFWKIIKLLYLLSAGYVRLYNKMSGDSELGIIPYA